MGIFDIFRRTPRKSLREKQIDKDMPLSEENHNKRVENQGEKIDFSRPVTVEEKEIAASVTAAILAGSSENSYMRVKSVTGIDTDKEIAAAVVAAIVAQDKPTAHFRLHSITRVS